MALIFMRAFALGGGTFTGIEAVSNGLGIMREPRVRTGKRTMVLMAISLSLTAGGILLAYLLLDVDRAAALPAHAGQTLNAILADLFAGHWYDRWARRRQGLRRRHARRGGRAAVVAAQAGFLDGPRVMSNMALDSVAADAVRVAVRAADDAQRRVPDGRRRGARCWSTPAAISAR